jgi:drug/metabolite transporter (DMT)-like permease
VESGLSAILFATMPLQTAIIAHALLANERLTRQKVAGIAIGFGGLLLVFRGQLETAGLGKAVPMLAIALSATCAAAVTVAVKRWGHDANPVSFNGFAMGVGAVALGAVSLVAGEAWSVPSWPEGIGAILYLALAGSVVTFVTYLWLLKRVEATRMSYIALVTPIVAVFLGVSVGNEALDPIALLGAAITLGGIYLSISKRAAAWIRGLLGVGIATDAAGGPHLPRKDEP